MNYSSPTLDAEITAHAETTKDALKRARIIAAVDTKTMDPEDQQDAYFWHPIAVCCSVGTITHKPAGGDPITKSVRTLTLAEFHDLPGKVWTLWSQELVETNPDIFQPEEVDNKKK